MPKKDKAKKNAKSNVSKNASLNVKRAVIEADIEGQIYGNIEKALGSCFYDVNCMDGMKRRCKVRSRKLKSKVNVGDCVIVSLRDFDNNNGDIIHLYDQDEVRQLQRTGALPSTDFIGNFKKNDEEDDDCAFEFDEI